MLVRIQLMLDRETKRKLEILSRAEGRSMSEIVREALKERLKREKKTKKKGAEFLLKLAKEAVAGPGDAEYDKYAYDL